MLESTEFPGSGMGSMYTPPAPPPKLPETLYELRPLSLGEILDRTFTLYRRRFWLFVGLAIVSASVVTLGSFVQMTWGAFSVKTAGAAATRSAIISGLSTIAILVFQIIAFCVTQAATVSAVSDVYLGRETSIGKAFRIVRAKWFRYILIVLWQAWSAFWLPTSLLSIGLFLIAFPRNGLRPVGIMIAILAVLSLVYSLIAYMRNSLAIVASVVESLKVRRSMRRSKDLVRGRMGRVFGLLAMMYILGIVAGVPQGVIAIFLTLRHGTERAILESVALLTTFVTHSLVAPIGAIAFCLLYIDARVRDEGFDVEMLLTRAVAPMVAHPPQPDELPSPFTSELI